MMKAKSSNEQIFSLIQIIIIQFIQKMKIKINLEQNVDHDDQF